MEDEIDLGIEHLADVREIGRGGFSVVYSATNTLLGKRVAVKVLGRLSRESDRRSFERECQVMGRLSHHPNVVTVHHASYGADGSPYLVMELVEGGSLADRLGRAGPMAWPEAIDQVTPIAAALAYVHEAGVLHRDIKPENILIGDQGQPLLTDFGIARLGESGTNTSTGIAASWLHAPPETFDNKREPRSDLYSLASTLYQLIAGRPPFWRGDEESLNPLMYRLVNEPPPRLAPELGPPALADALQRALAKDLQHRPPDVRSFGLELQQIRAATVGPANIAPAPSWPAPAPAAFDPNPRAAAAAAPAWFGADSPTIASSPPTVTPPLSGDVVGPATGPVRRGGRPVMAVAGAAVAAVLLIAGVIGVSVLSQSPGSGSESDGLDVASSGGSGESVPATTGATTAEPTEVTEAAAGGGSGPQTAGRLATVIERGTLNCGVNGSLPFFSLEGPGGTFTGFDIDFCRVVAAAVLGDASAVNFVPLTAAERFTALQSGDIDVLVRNTSQTATRSGELGVEFPFTIFFDGQTVMTPASTGISTLEDLDGAAICVLAGTTTEIRIGDALRDRGVVADLVVFEDNTELSDAYLRGQCDAWTSDASLLATFRQTLDQPTDHVILQELISSEPLAPAVASSDTEWAQAVEWSVMATVQAWEVGLDSTNIDSYDGTDPTALIIAGLAEFDPGFGLQPAYPRLVVSQVGNYEEIYNANFGDSGLPLEGSANDLARNGGLMFAPPLR